MIKIAAIITLVILIITVGCGFAIHFGGKEFANAVKGHLLLGSISILSLIALVIMIFINIK